jgi:capsular polysaccharide biosynthesis protein
MTKPSLNQHQTLPVIRSLTVKKTFPKQVEFKAIARSVIAVLDNLWKESPKICPNVRVWAETQDPSVAEVIYQQQVMPRTATRPIPKTIEPKAPDIFLESLSRQPIDRYLVRISKAQVIGNKGIVILPDGSYTEEPAKETQFLQDLPEYYSVLRHKLLKRRSVEGNYFSLMHIWATTGNYYHTLRDTTHRIYDVLQSLPDDVIFLVPQQLKTWQYEILATLGIPKERLCHFPKHEIWTIENLYFTPYGQVLDTGTTEACQWGRQAFYDRHNITAQPEQQTELIYISRALTSWRRIVNEDAVIQLLERYGFKTYLTERLSIGEQVALFSRAKAIVSVTGAALANVMFSQEGTQVLEISTVEHDPVLGDYYCEATWGTCEDMGHHYSYFHGESVDRPDNIRQDIFIPLDKLELSIQNLLSTLAPLTPPKVYSYGH